MTVPKALARVGIPRCRQAERAGHGGGKIIHVAQIMKMIIHFFAHAERAVVHDQFGNAEPRNARRREIGVGMDERNFFLQREAREQVVHPRFNRLLVVEIQRTFLGARDARFAANMAGTSRREKAMRDV